MTSVSAAIVALTLLVALSPSPLRVCADPNNLPFSNQKLEGFENKLAEMVAQTEHATVTYVWWAQRRGFLRNTLQADQCDVVMGYPSRAGGVSTTVPYYRSTYVFVTRHGGKVRVTSFDDPVLRNATIGVPLIGDDGANAPPAHALSRRGIVRNVRGYSVYGDYRTDSPPSAIIKAVASGEIDVALAWGPLAGYFAARQRIPLDLVPVSPQIDGGVLVQSFDISMAVRQGDADRLRRLNRFIQTHQREIDALLREYRVPMVSGAH